jgi:hypothetical protein
LVIFSTDQPAPGVRKNQIKDKFRLEMRHYTNEGKTTAVDGKEYVAIAAGSVVYAFGLPQTLVLRDDFLH